VLRPLQGLFKPEDFPDLLVGLDIADDAAVWRLDESRALVATTDFFTPVVDEPFAYGAIAAANSLSDIYAMGGQPFLALNIAAFPPDLPNDITTEIIRGGAEKAHEAGVVVAGGHTVQDKEPKFGMVVLGFVDPKQMITKSGAHPGDKLILTKPLGFGLTTTALKRDQADEADVKEVTRWMLRLNKLGRDLALEFGVRGGTDITGYSLLGHAWEMAKASGAGFKLEFSRIPFVSCARKYAEAWNFPGGALDNRHYFSPHIHFAPNLSEVEQMMLFDPQTSGGLLLAVAPEKMADFLISAEKLGQQVWQIGEVEKGEGIRVT
jgi:selenide, water dikinase